MLHPCIAKVGQNWTHFLTSEAHKEGFRTSEGPARSNQNTKRLDFEPFWPPRLDFEPFSTQDPPGKPRRLKSPHGNNLCIEVGPLARCRRAEGSLHVSESSLHRAESPLHVQRMRPHRAEGSLRFLGRPKYGPNLRIASRKFKGGKRDPKYTGAPPRCRIWSPWAKVRPRFTYSFRIDELGPRSGGGGAQGGGG